MNKEQSKAKKFERRTSDANNLEIIPGVGPSIAADFRLLGIQGVSDLRGKNPEKMYEDLMRKEGHNIDRCVLYVMRCAVYYASHKKHNSDLLKWWNWKDRKG